MAVGLAQIGGDWVDDDQGHVADLNDLSFEEIEIGLKIEGVLPLTIIRAHGRDDMNLGAVSTGSKEPRHDGIGVTIFSRKNDDAAERGAAFTAWPFPSRGYRPDDSN